jgi:hypothetical protein
VREEGKNGGGRGEKEEGTGGGEGEERLFKKNGYPNRLCKQIHQNYFFGMQNTQISRNISENLQNNRPIFLKKL